VAPNRAGGAAGVLTTTQQFASAAGVAAFGAVFFAVLGPGTSRGVFAHAAVVTTWLDLACAVATTVLAAFIPRPTNQPVRPLIKQTHR
jgi:hypothetical protein